MSSTDRKSYHRWFGLFSEHSWLRDYSDAIAELADMCQRPAHDDLVCDLIGRFVFVDADKRKKCLAAIVDQIVNHWALPVPETLIAPVTIDNEADSAQYIVQCLKPHFQAKGCAEMRILSNFGKCCQLRSIAQHQHTVLVDEFIGTGRTMIARIEQLRRTINGYVVNGDISSASHSIDVCALACMQEGKNIVENQNVRLFAPIWLKKGIAAYYEGRQRWSAYRAILELEGQLDKSKDDNYIFPCGYRKSESLYAMDEGNAVNNLFPIFWWPHMKDNRRRRTMFHRKDT